MHFKCNRSGSAARRVPGLRRYDEALRAMRKEPAPPHTGGRAAASHSAGHLACEPLPIDARRTFTFSPGSGPSWDAPRPAHSPVEAVRGG